MKKTSVGLLLIAAASVAAAEVVLPQLFDSHMVLQRDARVPVFGKAEPDEAVKVEFAGQTLETTAGGDGRWRVELAPMESSAEPRDLTVSSAAGAKTFTDVLVGDVWVCSGQRNMEYSFGWRPHDWEKFQEESAKFPTIRTCRIIRGDDPFPNADCAYSNYMAVWKNRAKWRRANDEDFLMTTAVGYFFARRLTIETGLPIAVIDASWSAQRIEPFIPQDALAAMDDPVAGRLKAFYPNTPEGKAKCDGYIAALRDWAGKVKADADAGREVTAACPEYGSFPRLGTHYNRMILPLTALPVKGVIWYQGCANAAMGEKYLDFYRVLVDSWRKAWNQPEMPIYSVQLAAFWNNWKRIESTAGGDGFTPVREAQRKSAAIPHTGVAVAYDLGEPYEIHPKEKYHVGERLAKWALRNEYGQKDLVCSGPLYKAMKIEGGAIRVSFDWTGSGLMVGKKECTDNLDPVEAPAGTPLSGFAIAGADREWRVAEARIDGDTVVVSSADVPAPVAVRYAYHGAPLEPCNLYNKESLPASPFRTDDW